MMINKWYGKNAFIFSFIYSIEMTHFFSHSTIMCLKSKRDGPLDALSPIFAPALALVAIKAASE